MNKYYTYSNKPALTYNDTYGCKLDFKYEYYWQLKVISPLKSMENQFYL